MIQQDIVAKTATIITLLNGILNVFFPKTMTKVYASSPTALHEHIMHVKGVVLTSTGILLYLVMFHDASLTTAVGWSQIIWIMEPLRNLYMGIPKKLGNPLFLELFPLLLAPTIMYYTCMFPNHPYSDGVARWFGYFSLATGLSKVVNPELDSKAWGCTEEKNEREISAMRTMGYFFLTLGTFITSLSYDIDKYKSLGFAWLAMFACIFIPVFITNEVKDQNVSVKALVPWFIIITFVIGTLLS